MQIMWLVFHDFGMVIVVLVYPKKKKKKSIEAKVVIKTSIKLIVFYKDVFNKYHYWDIGRN